MAEGKNLKIALINFSGNVGKSTLAKHLFQPRLGNAELVAIETINADEGADMTVNGQRFGQVQEVLLTADSAVIDIGASNVEAVMAMMRQYKGSHEDFDLFVIPVTKDMKQLRDTIGTIDALRAMGVPAHKIHVVPNMVDPGEKVEEAFEALFNYHADEGGFTLRPQAAIHFNEVYQKARESGVTVCELVDDQTDWKAALRTAANDQEKMRAISMITLRRLALSAKDNLDAVFASVAA